MREILAGLLVLGLTVSCDSQKPVENDAPAKVKPTSESRYRLSSGLPVTPSELDGLGKIFAGQLTDLTLPEAKECWVSLYTQSLHFESGDPSGFTGDFSQPGRDASDAANMTFAFYGFEQAVRDLEKSKISDEMADAPESIKKQILKGGEFHKSVVSLARCKFDDMIPEDSYMPYYLIYCAGAGIEERNKQYEMQANMRDHCNLLVNSFLETGDINPALLSDTPMR